MHRRALQLVSVTAVACFVHPTSSEAQFLGPAPTTASQQATGAALSPDFRGRITYQGNYAAEVVTPGRAPRNLNLRSILNSAASGRTEDVGGAITYQVEFNGSRVVGSYSGAGRVGRGTFNGTRNGSICTLFNDPDGARGTARCDRNVFNPTWQSLPQARLRYTMEAETNATQFVDAAEEDRLRAEQQAEQQRRAAAYAAIQRENERIVNGSGPLERRLDALAEIDSRSWISWRYQPGSMTNVRRENVRNANNYIAVGTFRYADGRPGTLRTEVRDGAFECLQFGNEPECRPIGQPPSHAAAASILGALIEDALSSPAPSNNNGPCRAGPAPDQNYPVPC